MTWEVVAREWQGLGLDLLLREERMPPNLSTLKGVKNYVCVITMKIQEIDILLYCMQDGGASVEFAVCSWYLISMSNCS